MPSWPRGARSSRSRLDLSTLGPAAQAQLRALGVKVAAPGQPARGRYNVAPKEERTTDGRVFASKWEMQAYLLFKQFVGLERMQLQVPFELQPAFTDHDGRKHRAAHYVADFVLTLPDGIHVVDTKGHETAEFRLKEKWFIHRHRRTLHKLWSAGELHDWLQAHGVMCK